VLTNLVVLAGPTACGKTATSLELCSRLRERGIECEVVSADSMQIYVGMDVGTDKLPWEKRLDPLHHMIDVCFPREVYSVARYRHAARSCLEGIWKRGRVAVVVGGSTLYLTALLTDIEIPPGELESALRHELERKARTDPNGLVEQFRHIDPDAFAVGILDGRNIRRVVRAFEIYLASGITYSELNRRWKGRKPLYPMNAFLLVRKREELFRLIEQRVDRMVERGLVDEVKDLLERGLSTTARQALGYKEAIAFIEGRVSHEEMVEEIKKRTRKFAKRQLTWFRNDGFYEEVEVTSLAAAEAAARLVTHLFE
jgi:tRNA dimethylallyltransferase